MTDIHTHILPAVDDGAQSMEIALEMLELSAERGTGRVLLTPHANVDDFEADTEDIITAFEHFREAAVKRGIPVELALGMEVFADRDFQDCLDEENLLTMNDSDYMLVEIPFHAEESFLWSVLEQIRCRGLWPILAHAERYDCIQRHPEIAYQLNREEVGIQINQGSLFGRFGQTSYEIAHLLLDCSLVQFVATDCHGLSARTPGLDRAWDYICKKYSKGYAELLLNLNPERLWNNREILFINPRNPRRFR